MSNTNPQIINLKLEIDHLKEYLHTDLCKKCEEFSNRLRECEYLLQQLIKDGA